MVIWIPCHSSSGPARNTNEHRRMRKRLQRFCLWLMGGAIVLLILPTLKNFALYGMYEHGNTSLARVEGESREQAGVWVGTFDTYQCGMDERHSYRLTLHADGTGHLGYAFYGDRLWGYSGNVYSWLALIPYDETKARRYDATVQDAGGTFIVTPGDRWFSSRTDTQYLAYERHGDELKIAWVNGEGEEPERWGLNYSRQLATPVSLIYWPRWLFDEY